MPIRAHPAQACSNDAQGGGNAGRSARRHSGDRSHDRGARAVRHADAGRHGRRCGQGRITGGRQLPLDRTEPQQGHGQLFRHAQPQQAEHRAGPEAPGRARCAAAPGRWCRCVRAQHASRRRRAAGSGLRRVVRAQSASGLCLRLRLPQGQQQAGASGVRRSDPGPERHGRAERRRRRRAALRAKRDGGQADRPDAGVDDRHGAVPSRTHRAGTGSPCADAGDHAVVPAGRAYVGRGVRSAGAGSRLSAHAHTASPSLRDEGRLSSRSSR